MKENDQIFDMLENAKPSIKSSISIEKSNNSLTFDTPYSKSKKR